MRRQALERSLIDIWLPPIEWWRELEESAMPRKGAVRAEVDTARTDTETASPGAEVESGTSPDKPGQGVVRRRLLAIDPGDVHVGMAEFVETDDDWECIDAYELTPHDAEDKVGALLNGRKLDFLVFEEWRLYPDKALAQSYSELEVVQLIGVIKFLHRLHLREMDRLTRPEGKPDLGGISKAVMEGAVRCELIPQPAGIKEATRGILRAHGVESEARRRKAGGHASDAEVHGWHFVLKRMGLA